MFGIKERCVRDLLDLQQVTDTFPSSSDRQASVQDYPLLPNVALEGERIALAAVTLKTCADFRGNMSELGWCLSIILNWAKFFFFCILPFGKQRTNKVQLWFSHLHKSVCKPVPCIVCCVVIDGDPE